MGLVEQIEKGRVGWPALEIQPQCPIQHLPMPLGEGFQITGAPVTTENAKHRHQKQEPLGIAHPMARATIRDGFEEADQICPTIVIIEDGCDLGNVQ